MKNILTLLLILTFAQINFGQTINENFDYATGTLTTLSSSWSESPTGSTDIQVKLGNLSYTNYPSSNVGSQIGLNGGNSRAGALISFPAISGNGLTVYASFLLNVTSTIDLDSSSSNGGYFAAFRDTTSSSAKRAYVYLRTGSSSLKYSIGLAKTSVSSLSWLSSELDINTTYLIVINYIFQSGDDAVKLWVNPNLSGIEPTENIQITTGTDASSLGGFQFLQRPTSGDEDIDGLRVAPSWSLAPLPVELTSFTANVIDNSVVLNWQTATEVNNYGFEIERQILNRVQNDSQWNKIGFVEGHGNSNSVKNYSLTDYSVTSGSYSYRLKQIDTDGKFEYSDGVEATISATNKFELLQNYPNPFNPTTQISFTLPHASKVNLSVFNTLGQKVAELANRYFEAGLHSVQFNAINLSSEMYFYKLTSGKSVQVHKMMLLK